MHRGYKLCHESWIMYIDQSYRVFNQMMKNPYKTGNTSLTGGSLLKNFKMSMNTLQYLPFYTHHLTALFFYFLPFYFPSKKKYKKIVLMQFCGCYKLFENDRFGRTYENRQQPA